MKYSWNWLVDRFFIKQPRLRRAVTRVMEGDSDQSIEMFGTKLLVNTLKEHGYLRASRLCRKSSLLRDEIAILVNLAFVLSDNDTFVDIGANVGFYSHTMTRFYLSKALFPMLLRRPLRRVPTT